MSSDVDSDSAITSSSHFPSPLKLVRPRLASCIRKSCLKSPSSSRPQSPASASASSSSVPTTPISATSDSALSDTDASGDESLGGGSRPRPKRSVSFLAGEEEDEVYIADIWDRTPTEPSLPLSYQDVMELEAIQRSLPRANQLPDPYTGKATTHFLSSVPVGLLPLLPPSPPPPTSPTTPTAATSGRDVTPTTTSFASLYDTNNSSAEDTRSSPSVVDFVGCGETFFINGEEQTVDGPQTSARTWPATPQSFCGPNAPTLAPLNTSFSSPTLGLGSGPGRHSPRSSPLARSSYTSSPYPPPPTTITLTSPTRAAVSPPGLPERKPFHPAYLSHLPAKTHTVQRPKPKFSFLPLLDTPANSLSGTPTGVEAQSPCGSAEVSRGASPVRGERREDAETTSKMEGEAGQEDGVDVGMEDTDPPTPTLTNTSTLSSMSSSPFSEEAPHAHSYGLEVDKEIDASSPSEGSYFPPPDQISPSSTATTTSTTSSPSSSLDPSTPTLGATHPHPLSSHPPNPTHPYHYPSSVLFHHRDAHKLRLMAIPSPDLIPPSPLSLIQSQSEPKACAQRPSLWPGNVISGSGSRSGSRNGSPASSVVSSRASSVDRSRSGAGPGVGAGSGAGSRSGSRSSRGSSVERFSDSSRMSSSTPEQEPEEEDEKPKEKRKKKKKVIIINDMEFELDSSPEIEATTSRSRRPSQSEPEGEAVPDGFELPASVIPPTKMLPTPPPDDEPSISTSPPIASASAHVKNVNVLSPTRLAMGHGARCVPETAVVGGRVGGGSSILVRSV